jgi:hypothetical protein
VGTTWKSCSSGEIEPRQCVECAISGIRVPHRHGVRGQPGRPRAWSSRLWTNAGAFGCTRLRRSSRDIGWRLATLGRRGRETAQAFAPARVVLAPVTPDLRGGRVCQAQRRDVMCHASERTCHSRSPRHGGLTLTNQTATVFLARLQLVFGYDLSCRARTGGRTCEKQRIVLRQRSRGHAFLAGSTSAIVWATPAAARAYVTTA